MIRYSYSLPEKCFNCDSTDFQDQPYANKEMNLILSEEK
jgi:hypothetical protein